MKKVGLALLGVLAILSSCSERETDGLKETSTMSKQVVEQNFVPNQVIVKFKTTSFKSKSDVMANFGGKLVEQIFKGTSLKSNQDEGVYLYQVNGSVPTVVNQLNKLENVEYAEPNYIYTTQVTSNDTYFTNGSLWGMYGDASSPSNAYGSQAAEAWAQGHVGSSSVYVGIIDEGYMYSHTDLKANAFINPGEIANNGIDDDGNGYIDDVYGWNFYGNNKTVFGGTSDDHGTHVAGTIGAVGGNGIGVAGVCWNVKLIGCKFIGTNGGTTANAILAIDYLVDLKTRHSLNLVAINNSWGGGGYSQSLKDAIDRAGSAGILFVVAAGNGGSDGIGDNNDSTPTYPANYTSDNIISVAALTSTGALASYSNYGATTVDIGAPGSAIYSCIPKTSSTSGYGSMSGTSMATPHVTGACALYASTHPGATMAQIKAAVLSSATATASLSGKCTSNGRLNVSGF